MSENQDDHFHIKAPCSRLSHAQCERLYAACLQILERTGILLYEQDALDLLKKAGVGAIAGNRVRIPQQLVEWARSTAQTHVALYDRHGEPAMNVGGRNTYFGPGSDCLYIVDHLSGIRRRAKLRDIDAAMTVADALSHIDFVMCMFLPEDVEQAVVDRYQMVSMIRNSSKPLMYVTTDFSGCVDAVAMAEIVRGGEVALREKPFTACYVNVTTGLVHNQEALQKLLYLSGKGLPFAYVPSTQGGVTAPTTVAAALAVSQAGALAGLVLSQLKREGTPFIMPGWGGNMLDMRTTVQPYADPDKRMVAADFVHWLGLPMFALAGCSDAKSVDQQAAAEAALTLMTDSLAGANIVHDLGYLESGLSGSLAQLVICDEILDWLSHFMRPVDISDESLALDLIDAQGPEGQYLDADHTYAHFRRRWYPNLFERDNYEMWHAQGGKTLGERATEKVAEILDAHQPDPLPDSMVQALEAILQRPENGTPT